MLEIGDVILVKETEQQKEQKHLDDVLGLIKKKEKSLIIQSNMHKMKLKISIHTFLMM